MHYLNGEILYETKNKTQFSLIAFYSVDLMASAAFTHLTVVLTAWGPLEVNLGFPVSC